MNGIPPKAMICPHKRSFRISFVFFSCFFLSCPAFCNRITVDITAIGTKQDDTTQVNRLIALFTESFGSDVEAAEKYANDALELSEKINYSKGAIDAHRAKGDVFRVRGDFEQARRFIARAISLSDSASDELSLVKNYLSMYKLLFVTGDYKGAEEFNRKSLEIARSISDPVVLAEVYGNHGISAGMKGEHIIAVDYFLKSLAIFKEHRDEMQQAVTLMRIGHTFELAGSYEKALDYLSQSLPIHLKLKNWSNAGWCLLNIGVTHSRIEPENHELKRSYYQRALAMAERSDDFRLKLASLDNIGGSYSMDGNYVKANAYLQRAYKLSKSAGHNSRTVFITGNLAENYLYTGQLDSAVLFGEENLRIAIQEKNTFEKRQAYSVLSQIYAAKNEDKKAYDMLLRHTKLSDSLFNVDKSRQIEDLREKYESEKKEQEITLLTKEKAAAEFRRNSFAVLSVLFLVVGCLVFVILKLRVRRNRFLLEKEIELDRMKSRFFANISHEFRTPLTLILGPIDDMISRPENTAIHRYLKPMQKNASRLLELVNQLLELSRIESGKLKPQLTKNNIISIVKGVSMSFESLAEIKNIQLDATAESESILIYIDREKFEKILTNLLSNSFKFTPDQGRISVYIRSTADCRLPGISKCLEIVVKDTGTGIPKAELLHIFDRFYQADNNQLHQQDGSGIGLALTKELVELHRGDIWARSDITEGTEICLQIPLNLEEILKDCVGESTFSGLERPGRTDLDGTPTFGETADLESDSSKPIVLLIEDNIDVRLYIRDALQSAYNMIEASDGEEGIALALDRIPDLVLCDVMMPKMDGNQVCIFLKKQEKTSHIPVILLTAKADMDSRIESLEIGADDYLTKPFVPKELLLRIQNLIESRQSLRDKYVRGQTLKPNEIAVNSVDEKFLKRMMDILEIHMADEKFGVEALGVEIGMSRSQLHRKLKALIGQGPNQFIRSFRLRRAHDLLKVNAATAAEIAYSVGFSSPSYFTKCFHEQFGYTPSEISNQLPVTGNQ